jgi:hypothetical protein
VLENQRVSRTAAAVVEPVRGIAVEPSVVRRAKLTNRPLARANGNTASGRRIRDLYRALMVAMGNPTDTLAQANALAAAELRAASEAARSRLLAGDGDADQVVRLEGAADRAERRLGIKQRRQEQPHVPLRERLLRERAGG